MAGILGSMTRAFNDLLLLENTRPQFTTCFVTKITSVRCDDYVNAETLNCAERWGSVGKI